MPNTKCWGPAGNQGCDTECYPTESEQNNFIALRNVVDGTLFAQYSEGDLATGVDVDFSEVAFGELYNATEDPWQMTSLYASADPQRIADLAADARAWLACSGETYP